LLDHLLIEVLLPSIQFGLDHLGDRALHLLPSGPLEPV